jgi:mannose-6-phosphate isomerase-like protein (cupin superfamily)
MAENASSKSDSERMATRLRRRTTSNIDVFERSGPTRVIYDLSTPDRVTITVPSGSSWTSGLHWHETHVEFLEVMQGHALVRLGDRSEIFGSEDGVIEVPKYTAHEWRRPEEENNNDQDLIVREWTVPADGQKEVFFRMLNSFLTEKEPENIYEAPCVVPDWLRNQLSRFIVPLQLFTIFRFCDNWPVLWQSKSAWLCWFVTHAMLGFSAIVGYVLGLRATYPEYLNKTLMEGATRSQHAEEIRKAR